MADPIWPPEFPQEPHAPAVQIAVFDQKQRTDMDLPVAAVQRNRSSTAVEAWQVAYRFDNIDDDPSQYELFRGWVTHTIDRGRVWFLLPVWRGGQTYSNARVRMIDATAVPENAGLQVLVTMTLEVQDAPRVSSSAVSSNLTLATG